MKKFYKSNIKNLFAENIRFFEYYILSLKFRDTPIRDTQYANREIIIIKKAICNYQLS